MPWSAKEAAHKTKEANTPKKRKAWATIANKALKTYKSEAKAIKIANAAVAKMGDDAMVDSVTTEVLMIHDRRKKRTIEKDQFGRVRKITEEHSTDPDELPPKENTPSAHRDRDNEDDGEETSDARRRRRGPGNASEPDEEGEFDKNDYRAPFTDAVYDREFSTEQRKEAASEGEAMKGGGFPIKNKKDLKNAQRALGRAKNRSATIKHIKKRAKALGVDLGNWPNDSADDLFDRRKTTQRDPFGRVRAVFEEEDDALEVVSDASTEITLYDRVEFDDAEPYKPRFRRDGYLVATPRVARTGIQVYAGSECGRDDLERVRVLRPDSAVFSDAAMRSYSNLPITLDHPPETVTSENWKHYAIGYTGEQPLRDGGSVRVPLQLADAAAIKKFEDGHNQLSVGYRCHLDWTPGVIEATGEHYDAIQRDINANHLAVVANARGGSTLKIGDDRYKEPTMSNLKTVTLRGIECQMNDTALALVTQLKDDYAKLEAAFDAFKKKKEEEEEEDEDEEEEKDSALKAKDAQIKTLQKQLADATSAERRANDARELNDTITKAKAVLGSGFTDKGKSMVDIQREVVARAMGDAQAKAWGDSEVAAAFAILPIPGGVRDAVAAFSGRHSPGGPGYGDPQQVKDDAYQAMVNDMQNAWMSPERRAANGK